MRVFVLLIALVMTFAAPARADDISAAQDVIRSQEQALGRDDAATAYSYAAPMIHQMFPGPEVFLSMVQRGYPPVYRHKSFVFGEGGVSDGRIAQHVHIIDADGNAWEALYTLEQEPDGSLKITGCSLIKAGQDV
jgi:hypothetical protein